MPKLNIRAANAANVTVENEGMENNRRSTIARSPFDSWIEAMTTNSSSAAPKLESTSPSVHPGPSRR